VANGRTATAKYGFALNKADLGTVVVEVQPGPDYDSGLFTGTVK
jgi:hypothetical protein